MSTSVRLITRNAFQRRGTEKRVLTCCYAHAAGNVKLRPELLEKHQAYTKEQLKSENNKPVFLVFHGGSGSTKDEITQAVKAGVVKMNVCPV